MIPPGIMASTARVRAPVTTLVDANYAKNTVLLLGNGTNGATAFIDQMANTWTANGNAQISTSTQKFGTGCMLFDGSGDYLSSSITSCIGLADFTVECWIRLASLASDCEIFCIGNVANVSQFDLVFETKTTGALRGSIQNGSGTALVDITSASSLLAINTYYHVAFTAEGTTARLRINGAVVATGTITGTRVNNQTQCRVGHLSTDLGGAVPRWFNGRIDDLRVTRGVCRYTGSGAATVPSAELPYVKTPTFVSRFSTTTGPADAQGVATDGTNIWYSNSTTIYKYTMAGVLVTSRVVSGDNPTTKNQINGMYIRNGRLYVSAAEFTGGVGISYIVEYDPTTLAYITHHQLTGDHFSEGLAWRDGHWWVVFHANEHVCKVDTNFVVRATYPLTFSITGSSGGYGAGVGYDGVVWLGDYLLCNIHEIYNEDYLDVYLWNGSGFTEVCRLPRVTTNGTQGICLDPTSPTSLYYAERNYAGVDAVAKTLLV
jgi:hypothetical protein